MCCEFSMSPQTLQLAAADFDAYLPERATSNAYSRPRIELKQRALAWARRVVLRLADLGIAVDLHGSDEHPSLRNKKRVDCQWVFFWRDPAARDELERLLDRGRSISAAIDDPSPYTRHAFLALRICATGVEVCFAVHPEAKVDVDNLRARLATAGERASDPRAAGTEGTGGGRLAAELTSALHDLPEQFAIGVGHDRAPSAGATPDALTEMLQRAAAGQEPLWIGWEVARETALEHVDILDEQLEDALVALAPIYRLVAWSRENDHIALDRRLERVERERAQTHAEVEAETERWRAEREAERERSLEQARARHDDEPRGSVLEVRRAHERTLDGLFSRPARASSKSEPPRGGAMGAAPARRDHKPLAPGEDKKARPERPHAVRPEIVDGHERAVGDASAVSPMASSGVAPVIDKGSRVRVLCGPFSNKCGVVSELDGRGGARVLLGLLATRVDVGDLEPVHEARDRPQLPSSHRKPDSRAAVTRTGASDPRKAR
jgi:hypothetical protein